MRDLPARTRVVLALVVSGALVGAFAAPAEAATTRIASQRWTSTAQLAAGTSAGTTVSAGAVRFGRAAGRTTIAGRSYEKARWTSPWAATGFGADEVVPSWNARTPGRSVVVVSVRVRDTGGRTGSWDTLARWAEKETVVRRSSGATQADDVARVVTDTVRANGSRRIAAWQVRVTLLRPKGTTTKPRLLSVGAVASVAARTSRPTSATTMTRTVELAVPRYSQMLHRRQYPRYDGGGAAWCSPTSTTMVLRSLGKGPTKGQYAWVRKGIKQRYVVHGARRTYDTRYGGTGNWGFNTAYAGSRGADAFVTRLASLREAEAFVKAGIPLVASVRFGPGGLSGAPIRSTAGHLLVIRGFTAAGNVIVNDPAAPRPSTVRRVYSRAQFERAWRTGSGGTAYVIRTGRSLPVLPGHHW
ncbi:peptidase C39 family protein [Mumia zhuanghuii]|uniref:Peptidase C39 family protein n=2 Tax=Mumia TaxID=1546255 RepID=A0ABW1QKF6_9ACTN|nr:MULTISPECIES: peptidase C39 family protein [Mumia]KAA1425381.1 peptidase C39 family protein [Mumia zhuanghuii]